MGIVDVEVANISGSISQIGDVSIVNPVDGHVLSYNGTYWTNQGTGSGDMVSGIYDPNSVYADVFDYNNFINKPTIIPEAPIDGQEYARKDSGWTLITPIDLSPYLTIVDATTSYEPLKGSDDNYVTDNEKIVIGDTSGNNTGDETLSSIKTKLGISILSGDNTGDQDLSGYAKLDDDAQVITSNDNITTSSGVINRDVNGDVSSIEYDNRTITVTRTSGLITSYTDGVNTWSINRDVNDVIIGWDVT